MKVLADGETPFRRLLRRSGAEFIGALMNPARSLGPALIAGVLDNQWIYLFAPIIGTILGGVVYQSIRESSGEMNSI